MTAYDVLTVANVLKPLGIELLRAQGGKNRVAGYLTVTRIASSLNVRTVGGMTRVHICKHRVKEGPVRPIKSLIVTLKSRRNGNRRVNHLYRYGLSCSDYLEIAEAKPGKFRLRDTALTVGDHAHCICNECGRVFDYRLLRDPEIDKSNGDFNVTSIELVLRGKCSECNAKDSEFSQHDS
jgi:hypothetical protein